MSLPAPAPSGPEPFAVLMPLWAGDRADRFRAAAASATLEQTLRPDLLVLTVDGPLGDDLEAEVRRIEDGELGPALVLRHARHQGLAAVLQDALEQTPHEVIARADADDLCRPERFARQLPAFVEGGLDLLGSAMQEFSDEVPAGTGPTRRRPCTHKEIFAYLPRHCPLNHPTVVMRRETALAAGGYRELPTEDYWLWERMILAGARCGNLPDVLVDYRVDPQLFARRGGWRMLAADLRMQRIMVADHVVGPAALVRNLIERTAYRLMPGAVRRIAYRLLVERRS